MISDAVQWWGIWEHAACGVSGEAQFADDDIPDADHDCGLAGDAVWHAEWRCDDCGASGDDIFTDGYSAYCGHECDEDDLTDDGEDLEAA